MEKTLSTKSFWILAVLVAAVIFAVGINRNKVYQAEIKILILPKSEVAARNIDQIVENAKEIPNALSFYDKLVANNPAIDQGISGLPGNERRETWKSKIEMRRIGKSGMISVSAFNTDQIQAEEIATQVAADLQFVLDRYYDSEKNLDIRIVDGPIIYLVSRANLMNWVFFGLAGGMIISLIVISLINFSVKGSKQKQRLSKSNISLEDLSRYDFRKTSKIASQERKATAPANLPIAEATPLLARPEEINLEFEEKPQINREPTADEVREKLNRLLRGN